MINKFELMKYELFKKSWKINKKPNKDMRMMQINYIENLQRKKTAYAAYTFLYKI